MVVLLVACKGGAASMPGVKMTLTLTDDDPRYPGAAILTGIEPPAVIAKDLRMSTYPAVLTADGMTLAYLHVSEHGPLELRMFRPGTPPRVLVTFDSENDGSPRLAWSPDGSRLALIELRLGPSEDWRHPRTRLTVLEISGGRVTGRFETPVDAYRAGLDELAPPVWKDNRTVSYHSMEDGMRGPVVDVVTTR
jgi:hypothetical protein